MAQKDERRGQAIVARQFLKAVVTDPRQVEFWQACFGIGLGLEFCQALLQQVEVADHNTIPAKDQEGITESVMQLMDLLDSCSSHAGWQGSPWMPTTRCTP